MKAIKRTLLTIMMAVGLANMANAQSIEDILGTLGNLGQGSQSTQSGSSKKGGSGIGGTLGNMLEGVFSSSNITVADMAGVWTVNGPAVCFQSDNFLKKAGGIAAAAAIEQKLSPYFNQYGLNGGTVTINTDGTFSIKVKGITLRGNITDTDKGQGVFDFNFTALGAMRLGTVTCYAQKTSGTLNLMFDATKLKKLVTTVANVTGINLAKTLGSILDSYDGLCVGFRMEKTGNVSGTQTQTQTQNGNNGVSQGRDSVGSGLDILRDILGGGKKRK